MPVTVVCTKINLGWKGLTMYEAVYCPAPLVCHYGVDKYKERLKDRILQAVRFFELSIIDQKH